MPAQQQNSALPWVLGGVVVVGLGYKYLIKPGIVDPARIKHYARNLRVTLPAVRFKGDNIEFDMYVQNPNVTPMTIQALVGDIFVTYGPTRKNLKVGNVFDYKKVVIKPTAETKYTFAVRQKVPQMIMYWTAVFAGKATGQVLTFIGNITIDGRVWPIKEQLRIS